MMIHRLFFFPFIILAFSACGQNLTIKQLKLAAPRINNCTTVKDQYMSSTCWSFASNSIIESEMIRRGKGNIDLSEMFIARHSYIRKIYQYLRLKGQNYFTPGGQFHDVMWVIKNYGMMPESAYSGRTEGALHHDHAILDTLVKEFALALLKQGKQEPDSGDLSYLNQQFDHYLGELPATFIYNSKEYTPTGFARDLLQFNPDDYLEITSYTHHPFYKSFVLEDKYNWTFDKYYNVPLADFSRITEQALQKGFTVGWDGDADDPCFHYYDGLAYLNFPVRNAQLQRQKAFDDQSTLLDHLMHITGVARDHTGVRWYYVKNSWGNTTNPLGGFLFMREDYFKLRTVAIIVNKNAVPADIRKKLKI